MDVCQLSGTPVPNVAPLAPARLMSAPLPELLAEANAEIIESSITDDSFLGAVATLPNGRIHLHMPPGRHRIERDHMARVLVGRMLGTPLAPLPASLKTLGGAR